MDVQWARHWDTICLGTVTIATAVLGAVILLAGGLDIALPISSGTPSVLEVAKAVSAGVAAILYLILTTFAGISIYVFPGDNAVHIGIKRWIGSAVYLLFVAEVFALALLLIFGLAFGTRGV